MVVCRYYLQGNCKFGDRCRYEHPPGLGGRASRQQVGPGMPAASGQAGFPASGLPTAGTPAAGGGTWPAVTPNAFNMSGGAPYGVNDSARAPDRGAGSETNQGAGRGNNQRKTLWDWWREGHESGVWPLSCYGNTYAKSSVKGVDVSFEELRADAYAAVHFQGASLAQIGAQEASRVHQALETAQQMLQRQAHRQASRTMQGMSTAPPAAFATAPQPMPPMSSAVNGAFSATGEKAPSTMTRFGTESMMMPSGSGKPPAMATASSFAHPENVSGMYTGTSFQGAGAVPLNAPQNSLDMAQAYQSIVSPYGQPVEAPWSMAVSAGAGFGEPTHRTNESISSMEMGAYPSNGNVEWQSSSGGTVPQQQQQQQQQQQLSDQSAQAFAAEHFSRGAVPETPPPSHFC